MQRINLRSTARERRARAYMPIGDQLDALMKLAQCLEDAGITLPDQVKDWVGNCQKVKDDNPL